MNKLKLLSIFLGVLIVMLPICFAEELQATDGVTASSGIDKTKTGPVQSSSYIDFFPGLVYWLAVLIAPFVTFIAISAAVVVAGYVVYRVGYSIWIYYTAYSYTSLSSHAYDHINDFPNIWKGTPPRKDFEKKCKDNMNSKSSSIQRFIQLSDGRSIAYDPITQMVTIGETDGKNIITCYKDKDISSKTKGTNPTWKRIN